MRLITPWFRGAAPRSAVAAGLLVFASAAALCAPVVPADDAEVVEHLPARLNGMTRLLRDAAGTTGAAPSRPDPARAAARGRALLDEARDRGDPRYAGYALAAIAPWRSDPEAPAQIAILAATLAQYQHDFDGSRRMLEVVLARDPANPQATLTLATIARVQGRYDDSDRRCREVTVELYRDACLAENAALRGRFDEARGVVTGLLAASGRRAAPLQQWLATTLAELEERAGNAAAADAAYRRALALGRDSYLTLDYVDFLIAHGRDADAERLLVAEPQPYGDGVLLRLAIARKDRKTADAATLASELRDRFDAAKERGDAISIHGRELARALVAVQGDATGGLSVARDNLRIQKEPADFLVMAEAARAAKDDAALREVAAAAKAIGLVDRRLAAIVERR